MDKKIFIRDALVLRSNIFTPAEFENAGGNKTINFQLGILRTKAVTDEVKTAVEQITTDLPKKDKRKIGLALESKFLKILVNGSWVWL